MHTECKQETVANEPRDSELSVTVTNKYRIAERQMKIKIKVYLSLRKVSVNAWLTPITLGSE